MRPEQAELALQNARKISKPRLLAGLHALRKAGDRLKGGGAEQRDVMGFVRPHFFVVGVMRLSVVLALTVAVLVAEVEEVEEIAERRTVERHVGIIVLDDRVGEIIAAATR